MLTDVTLRAARVRRGFRPDLRWLGSSAVVVIAVLAGSIASARAEGPRICGDRHQILEQLKQEHQEQVNGLGLSADGGVLELLVSPEGGWTILVTYPERPTCVVAVGKAWQPLQVAGEPA
jgi:hypothetical protein